MTKFKNIEALGLHLKKFSDLAVGKVVDCVEASDLESLLEKGVRMYGYKMEADCNFNATKTADDEVQGLMIDVKPIPKPKPATKAELRSLLYAIENHHAMNLQDIPDLLKRVLESGVE